VNTSTGDRGGNALFYGRSREELHAYWDTVLVDRLGAGRDYVALAGILGRRPEGPWRTAGDYHGWAAKWATESSRAAAGAYEGIRFGKATLGRSGQLERIRIELPSDYAERSEPVAAQRLQQAGLRLAELLNRILGS
jgi:hypothetical protein